MNWNSLRKNGFEPGISLAAFSLVKSSGVVSCSEICDKLCYLSDITNQIDLAAKTKYKLAKGN